VRRTGSLLVIQPEPACRALSVLVGSLVALARQAAAPAPTDHDLVVLVRDQRDADSIETHCMVFEALTTGRAAYRPEYKPIVASKLGMAAVSSARKATSALPANSSSSLMSTDTPASTSS
jgi:hypothetical protein